MHTMRASTKDTLLYFQIKKKNKHNDSATLHCNYNNNKSFTLVLLISDKLAHSMAGTKPYMAPEIFYTVASGNAGLPGYTFSADW